MKSKLAITVFFFSGNVHCPGSTEVYKLNLYLGQILIRFAMWIIHSNMKRDKRNEINNSMFETERWKERRGEGNCNILKFSTF